MRRKLVLVFGAWLAAAGVAPGQPEALSLPTTVGADAREPAAADSTCEFWTLDGSRRSVWFRAEYLLWWTKQAPLAAPLVTFGSDKDAPFQGVIGQAGTTIAFGGSSVDFGHFSGMRFGGGFQLTPDGALSLEGSWFGLENRTAVSRAASDGLGNPVIAHPIISAASGNENSELVSSPLVGIAGATTVALSSQLQGWDVNLAWNCSPRPCLNVSGLVGFRALDLKESLTVSDSFRDITGFPGGAGLTFLGQLVRTGEPLFGVDNFSVRNQFWGPQLGGRVGYAFRNFNLDAFAKIALGVTQQSATIDGFGSAIVNPGGLRNTAVGSVYAQSSNIGHQFHNAFAVVPEVGLNISYQVTPRIAVGAGYSFLYWSSVVRPGDLVDRTVNRFIVPTDQNFGLGTGPARPAFNMHSTDYWAHGLNFSLLFTY
jgi:Putative beta barrel porin-7 (BBP7)